MLKFKTFLKEAEEAKDVKYEIIRIIDTMGEDELQELGAWLYSEFFEPDEEEDGIPYFTIEDIKGMIDELPSEIYLDVLDELEIEDEESEAEETNEGVTAIMMGSRKNKKKRKFMKKGRATLKREEAQRKRENRINSGKRKRYYRANKSKIKHYQASRRDAINRGAHFVKLRRKN